MRQSFVSRTVSTLLIAVLCLSCASTNLPPISDAGAAFEPAADEARLWRDAREEELRLRGEADLYPDPLLADYLDGIVRRLNPPEMQANRQINYSVSVIRDPTLNAFAYPHGALYVHTGLLSRMENEAQLATVLGHEMTHVEDRHMVRHRRAAQNRQIGAMLLAFAGAIAAAKLQSDALADNDWGKAATIDIMADLIVGLGLQLAFLASVNGYGRGLEREADHGGLVKMRDAGYDVREAEKVYQALADATAEPSKFEAYFFGSHPNLKERVVSAREWAVANPPLQTERGGLGDTELFAKRLRPVVRDDAALNIELGRLGLAEQELMRALGMLPEDPITVLLIGRLKLAQAEEEADTARRADLIAAAEDALREAARLDPQLAEPHRELGLLAYRAEDYRIACNEFSEYLRLAPDAEESSVIRDYITELRASGHCR